MTLELRILNGLHRGASLPVEPGVELVLGSDSGSDVVLMDLGMPASALRLAVEADGWQAHAIEAAEQAPATQPQRLALGVALDLHGIRVCVCQSDQPWAFEPARPAQVVEDDDALVADDLHAEALPGPGAPDIDGDGSEPAPHVAAAPGPLTPSRGPRSSVRGWWRRRAWLALPTTVLLGMVTFRAASMVEREPAALAGTTTAPGLAASAGAPAASAPATPEELRRLFKARLQAAELLNVLEVDLTEDRWSLRGDLGPEEDARLERLVAAFFQQHHPNVAFVATIVPAEELLPFRIAQVSTGRLAHVVTSDGQRLFVGDQHKGYTLARVDANRLVFTGKRRIEVAL